MLMWRCIEFRLTASVLMFYLFPLDPKKIEIKKTQNVSIEHGCPARTIMFNVQWTLKWGLKLEFGIKIRKIRSY